MAKALIHCHQRQEQPPGVFVPDDGGPRGRGENGLLGCVDGPGVGWNDVDYGCDANERGDENECRSEKSQSQQMKKEIDENHQDRHSGTERVKARWMSKS